MREILQMLPLIMLQVRERFLREFRPVFARYDVTEAQWRALRVVERHGEIDFTQLAVESVVAKSSLSRIVRDLTARGLFVRREAADDQRKVLVALSPAGEELIAKLLPEIELGYRRVADEVGAEQVERLRHAMEPFLDPEVRSHREPGEGPHS